MLVRAVQNASSAPISKLAACSGQCESKCCYGFRCRCWHRLHGALCPCEAPSAAGKTCKGGCRRPGARAETELTAQEMLGRQTDHQVLPFCNGGVLGCRCKTGLATASMLNKDHGQMACRSQSTQQRRSGPPFKAGRHRTRSCGCLHKDPIASRAAATCAWSALHPQPMLTAHDMA